jgi:hypothetical protein
LGRSLKNTKIKVGETTAKIPGGSTTLRPSSSSNGQIRYNTTDNVLEAYINGSWSTLRVAGAASITKDTFTGDGSTLVFGPMSFSYTAGQEKTVLVFINNVFQNPGVAFTFDGTTNITFTSPPPLGHTIVLLHGYAS